VTIGGVEALIPNATPNPSLPTHWLMWPAFPAPSALSSVFLCDFGTIRVDFFGINPECKTRKSKGLKRVRIKKVNANRPKLIGYRFEFFNAANPESIPSDSLAYVACLPCSIRLVECIQRSEPPGTPIPAESAEERIDSRRPTFENVSPR
jgi:hypothetical protein